MSSEVTIGLFTHGGISRCSPIKTHRAQEGWAWRSRFRTLLMRITTPAFLPEWRKRLENTARGIQGILAKLTSEVGLPYDVHIDAICDAPDKEIQRRERHDRPALMECTHL
jgi:hypothetical protein